MKNLLITGVTGFLGGYLIEELKNNYNIIGTGRNETILNALKNKFSDSNDIHDINFKKVDLVSESEVLDIPKCDLVIHAASLSTVWGKWEDFYNNNFVATKNILNYCLKNKVKRLVYISSPSIYSETKDRFDIKESEFNPNNDLNYYIKSKIMCEKLLLDSINSVNSTNSENSANSANLKDSENNLEIVIIRPKGLIGLGDTSILPRILYANQKIGIPIFDSNKDVIVDLTSVRNVAYAIHLALIKENISGEVFNITNGEPMPQKVLIDIVMKRLQITPKYKKFHFGLTFNLVSMLEKFYKLFKIEKEPILTRYSVCTLAFSQTLNIDKAKEKLGYLPKITLEQEIESFTNIK